jgi:hypothetical protein
MGGNIGDQERNHMELGALLKAYLICSLDLIVPKLKGS